MSGIRLSVREEIFPVAGTFTISRGSRTEIHVVTVELSDGAHKGRGECVPYARYDETVPGVIKTIRSLEADLATGLTREALQTRLPAGAARNGLDCAFWDLEAKKAGRPAWRLAGLVAPAPLKTAYTLSLDTPEKMQEQAAKHAHMPLLKVKLGTQSDLERIEAVRRGAPVSTIIVDANEGWSVDDYKALAPQLVRLGVAMVEQPLPAAEDEALRTLDRVLPVCADESCHDRKTLGGIVGKYDLINIKLDKTGGLTEALALKAAALEEGFGILIGCMLGTSLGMAPATLLGRDAAYIDLDGPLLLAADRPDPLVYDGAIINPPSVGLWG